MVVTWLNVTFEDGLQNRRWGQIPIFGSCPSSLMRLLSTICFLTFSELIFDLPLHSLWQHNFFSTAMEMLSIKLNSNGHVPWLQLFTLVVVLYILNIVCRRSSPFPEESILIEETPVHLRLLLLPSPPHPWSSLVSSLQTALTMGHLQPPP